MSEELIDMTDEQASQIDRLSELGNDAMDDEKYDKAIAYFTEALGFVPQPKEDWEATGWLYASIGDAYFMQEEYSKSLDYIAKAYTVYGDDVNPFILLRYGQCACELGDEKKAVELLLRAYMLEGEEIFEGEEKYLEFLSARVKL